MGTFLIVLVIVGTMIVLGTRFSFYLYKSGALANTHVKHSRRLHPVAVGVASKEIPPVDAINHVDVNETRHLRAGMGIFLGVLVPIVPVYIIHFGSLIGAASR